MPGKNEDKLGGTGDYNYSDLQVSPTSEKKQTDSTIANHSSSKHINDLVQPAKQLTCQIKLAANELLDSDDEQSDERF